MTGFLERCYLAAKNAGLLTAITVRGGTTYGGFRAPDETVLDGFALARDYQLIYLASWLTLSPGDVITIHGADYEVREVRAVGDGTERQASLSLI